MHNRKFKNKHKPYMLSYTGEASLERIGNQLIINPFMGTALSENPLKQKERTYPVDFIYKQSETFISNISIPEGYEVEFLPSDISLSTDLIEIRFNTEEINRQVSVKGSYAFKKSMYSPSEYDRLKKNLDLIVRKFNDSVIFKIARSIDLS